MLKGWALAAAAALGGCVTSEETYERVAKGHLGKGPIAACCSGLDAAGQRQTCEKEAATRCAFARDAVIRATRVSRFGHDDGALVELDLDGPGGKGHCTCQVMNYPRGDVHVQGCGCQARQ